MKRYERACVQAALRSPSRPAEALRENCRAFWRAIALGRSSEDAAVDAGVSPAVGVRWFRRAGGMPPTHFAQSSKPISERYLSLAEREEIAIWRAQGKGVCAIARLPVLKIAHGVYPPCNPIPRTMPPRPPHPIPTFGDDGQRPFLGDRMA